MFGAHKLCLVFAEVFDKIWYSYGCLYLHVYVALLVIPTKGEHSVKWVIILPVCGINLSDNVIRTIWIYGNHFVQYTPKIMLIY